MSFLGTESKGPVIQIQTASSNKKLEDIGCLGVGGEKLELHF